ncbi:MAG TPA: hypothetical protein VIQ11_04275, partial [Mycobacterium sp.]
MPTSRPESWPDPALFESARGMGMNPVRTLLRIELPLAWHRPGSQQADNRARRTAPRTCGRRPASAPS